MFSCVEKGLLLICYVIPYWRNNFFQVSITAFFHQKKLFQQLSIGFISSLLKLLLPFIHEYGKGMEIWHSKHLSITPCEKSPY